MSVKKEERLLRALGNVRDSYVAEVARYVGGPQGEQLVKPKRKKWPRLVGLTAAAAAVVVTGALSLNLLANRPAQSDFTPLSNTLQISNMTVRRVTFVTSQTQNPRPIEQVQVSLGDEVVQTIDKSDLPEIVQGYNEGLFLSVVPIEDLPSDIPGCNQGLFYRDEKGRLVRSDVDYRDVNFDGYNDLGLAAVDGYPENLSYNYFLWNPETEQFEYGFTLYGGAALEVDESRKLLIEHTVGNGEEFLCYYYFASGHLCSVIPEMLEQFDSWPEFTFQCDTQKLSMGLGLGGLNISPKAGEQRDIVNDVTIEFLPGILPDAAMEQSRKLLADDQTAIHQDQETGVYSFHYERNSQVIEVYIHSAGSFGSYRITSMYGLEDGWGGVFQEICDSFTCPLSESAYPEAEKVNYDAVNQASDWPAFQMEYDHSKLELVEGVGGVFLYPIEYPDDLPVSELKIEFLPGLLPNAAMEQSRKEMALTSIHQDQETERYSFRIDQGTDWNSVVKEVTIVGAGSCGSFRLTSQYFVEATEGWGSNFAQIVAGFTCPLSESPNPEAEKVIMDFADGYFSGNRITMLANYYGDSQDLQDVYTQDASRVRIVSLQGLDGLEDWIEKDGFAHVSLAFLETEQDDSYSYLSMEVMKTQAGYRVTFYGLEK